MTDRCQAVLLPLFLRQKPANKTGLQGRPCWNTGAGKGFKTVTVFYISPSSLSFKQYTELVNNALSFGWSTSFVWPRSCFQCDAFIDKASIARAFTAIAGSDIFIAVVPGTASTNIEIGAAYMKCDGLFLVARDPVHFTQTGLCDSHLAMLPDINRVCCELEEIPSMLKLAYLHLVDC